MRFANIVTRPANPDWCIDWPGTKFGPGYGMFNKTTAHRTVYSIFIGDLPEDRGMVVDHLCRNPSCVNPFHLELVSNTENTLRGLIGVLKTHCKNGHEFTVENTIIEKGKYRRCRICKADKARRTNDKFINQKRNTCSNCGKAISRISTRCLSCSAIERESRPEIKSLRNSRQK